MTTIHRYQGYGGNPVIGSRKRYTYESEHPAGGDPRRKVVENQTFENPVALWCQNGDGVWIIRRIAEAGDSSNDLFTIKPARLVSQA
jgi:hypothetical protein